MTSNILSNKMQTYVEMVPWKSWKASASGYENF